MQCIVVTEDLDSSKHLHFSYSISILIRHGFVTLSAADVNTKELFAETAGTNVVYISCVVDVVNC